MKVEISLSSPGELRFLCYIDSIEFFYERTLVPQKMSSTAMRSKKEMKSRISREDEKDSVSTPSTPDFEESSRGDYGDPLSSEEDLFLVDERKGKEARQRAEAAGFSGSELDSIEEKAKGEKREKHGHLRRVERKIKLADYRAPRDERDFHQLSDTYDCITLRLSRLPYDPTTIKGADKDVYKNIFGQRRDFAKRMADISADRVEDRVSKHSARDYLAAHDDTISGRRWQAALQTHRRHTPEWLHTVADCLGGPITIWNGAAGGYGANTQMLAIEGAIKGMSGVGIEVNAYTRPGTRIAEWYQYTVFAYGKDGTPLEGVEPLQFIIDARNQWYTHEEWDRDRKRINNFLDSTHNQRAGLSSQFELPEIISLRLIDGDENPLLKQGHYLEAGPVFAQNDEHRQITLANLDDHKSVGEGLRGRTRYEGYRKRMLKQYPFNDQEIMGAIKTGNLETISALFAEKNLQLDIVDGKGNTLLHYAAQYGNDKLVAEICASADLSYIDKVNNNGQNALHIAAQAGKLAVVQKLQQYNANEKDANDNTLLHFAIYSRDLDLIKYLLAKSNVHAVNKKGETPLHIAARLGFDDAIPLLIAQGAIIDVADYKGDTPAHIAARFNRSTFIAELAKNKADLTIANEKGDTPLHVAAAHNSAKAIAEILNGHKINPDIPNIYNGNTALHTAAEFGQSDAIQALCDEEATIDAINNAGDMPVHVTAYFNQGDAILTLQKNEAKMQAYNRDELSPLHIATHRSNLDAIQALALAQVDLNQLTGENNVVRNTALHIAAEQGDSRAVRILIDAKANQEEINHDFSIDRDYSMIFTPQEWAENHGQGKIYQQVLDHLDEDYFVAIEVSEDFEDALDDELAEDAKHSLQGSADHAEEDKMDIEGYGSPDEFQQPSPSSSTAKARGRWYDSDDMSLLLNHYLRDQDVEIMAAIDLEQDDGQVLIDNLHENLANQIQAMSATDYMSRYTVCPINFGNNHWTALVIKQNYENPSEPTIYFVDSLGKKPDTQQQLATIISNSCYRNAHIVDLSDRYQRDGFRCGSWAIAHIESLVKHQVALEDGYNIQSRRTQDDAIILANQLVVEPVDISRSKKTGSASSFADVWSSSKPRSSGFDPDEQKARFAKRPHQSPDVSDSDEETKHAPLKRPKPDEKDETQQEEKKSPRGWFGT